MRYFVRSLLYGWAEVSKENFDKFVENLRTNAQNIPSEIRNEYIASRTKIIED